MHTSPADRQLEVETVIKPKSDQKADRGQVGPGENPNKKHGIEQVPLTMMRVPKTPNSTRLMMECNQPRKHIPRRRSQQKKRHTANNNSNIQTPRSDRDWLNR